MYKEIHVKTTKRLEFIDITPKIREYLDSINAKEGILTVFVPHTTAAVTINENADPSVVFDILGHTQKMIPKDNSFTHSEGNSDAHIKSSLFSASLNLIIDSRAIMLGTWQGVYFAEFDGPRDRKIWFKFISG